MKWNRANRRIPLVVLFLLAGAATAIFGLAHSPWSQALPIINLPTLTLPTLLNPRVVSVEPSDKAVDVPYDPIVSVDFDRAVDISTLSSAAFYLRESGGDLVPADLKQSTDGLGWYLYPQVVLEPGTTYVATLTSGIKSALGLAVLGTPVSWSFTTVFFTDVSSKYAYAVAVSRLAAAKIISGYDDHSFRPHDPVKRQQFAKMIVRSLSLPCSQSDICTFTDVPGNLDPADPLYPDHYVAVCAAHKITAGKTPSTFAPYDTITRFQLITFVVRAINDRAPGALQAPPATFVPTWDPALSPDHGQNARLAEYNHLLDGIPLASLDPWGAASRGEVAQVLWNMWHRIS